MRFKLVKKSTNISKNKTKIFLDFQNFQKNVCANGHLTPTPKSHNDLIGSGKET